MPTIKYKIVVANIVRLEHQYQSTVHQVIIVHRVVRIQHHVLGTVAHRRSFHLFR
jgi:hypothetical protein